VIGDKLGIGAILSEIWKVWQWQWLNGVAVVANRVVVAMWQWWGWLEWVIASILIGDKSIIGAKLSEIWNDPVWQWQ
jgi:hypothetical protein